MINNECQSTTLDAVYQKLTGINIGEQIDEWDAEDVAFIKMTNLQVKRIKYVYGEKPLLTDYEIVLYEAK